VRIPKYCVRISPWILTTDPRPRPQADAVSDPLSVRESATRFLTTSPQVPATAVCPIHVSVVHRRNFAEYVGRRADVRRIIIVIIITIFFQAFIRM